MELVLPELLSREDILDIFNQRQLHINNMNELGHADLLRIYKTFAMPLSRRRERNKNIKQNMYNRNRDYKKQYTDVEHLDTASYAMDVDYEHKSRDNEKVENVIHSCCSMDADHIPVEALNSTCRMPSPIGEKRRQRESDEHISNICKVDYQYQLTSVTKRIRIDSA